MQKVIITIFIFLLGGLGYLFFNYQNNDFEKLSSEEMLQKIIEERDVAITKAVKDGIYNCCINPPCTMCYMEANQWNNEKAGTCACDDLIAQGKEPCPQCKSGREGDSCSSCKFNNN